MSEVPLNIQPHTSVRKGHLARLVKIIILSFVNDLLTTMGTPETIIYVALEYIRFIKPHNCEKIVIGAASLSIRKCMSTNVVSMMSSQQ